MDKIDKNIIALENIVTKGFFLSLTRSICIGHHTKIKGFTNVIVAPRRSGTPLIF